MSLWHRLTSRSDSAARDARDEQPPVVGEADDLDVDETAAVDRIGADPVDGAPPDFDDADDAIIAEIADAHADLVDRFDRLLGDVAKLGREQFRATTLLEGHDAILEELAEAWREEQERRAAGAIQERLARAEIEAQARLGMVKELLPVADALDASAGAARELLAALRAAPSPSARRSWLPWLSPSAGPLRPAAPADDRASALEAWLRGLLLIEERLRGLLDREGVRPMHALGERFDPHRHLAVAVGDANGVPDGTIVAEDLRGYTAGDRVLRHAEVVVARGAGGSGHLEPGTE